MIAQLKFTETEGVQKAMTGKGAFIISDNMEALLKAGGVRMETLQQENVQFIRRKNSDGTVYFINNRTAKEVDGWLPLNSKAQSAAIFDAMTGTNGIAKYRMNNGAFEVMVQLKPFESRIIQLYNTKRSGPNFPYFQTDGKPVEIKGEWTLYFMTGGPVMPVPVKLSNLASWTEIEGDAYKNFSGTAKYSTTFTKPGGKAAGWLLNLGKVNETAEVFLNGKKLITLIGPEFSTVIPDALLKENNTIEIIVANLMANRISYMDKNNIPWKKFYNTNMPARRRENTKNGLFDASAWQPLPSGLSGPVTLTPVSFEVK
jgi:hypothetical protein